MPAEQQGPARCRLRDLKAGQRFRYLCERAVYEYMGERRFCRTCLAGKRGGGPWRATFDNPIVEVVTESEPPA